MADCTSIMDRHISIQATDPDRLRRPVTQFAVPYRWSNAAPVSPNNAILAFGLLSGSRSG
ncbi:hypothetical protein [Agrobacterium pusense]|uniref:hypothetical protein n=1 Tax=Agrobacterium pusense TaxID=648995 RepID=UPI00156B2B0A|nr:hypothetical protein [Agrobacterium pusense]MBW9069269.1 hypothetical protein [Agrobacterium pusense]MBW9083781.1 hypothetical protein [Agrobacterium pusense]MBW9123889.1 hypothetical protein [Agrobacterium pusense]MBW9136476.1 hypothetical protein [Agrobacterium pusense]QKJ93246.1 hypothetical protein HQN82_17635 [Agrobacterium pusense]